MKIPSPQKAAERRRQQLMLVKAQNNNPAVIITALASALESLTIALVDMPELKQHFIYTSNDLRWWCKLAGMREFKEELKEFPKKEHTDKQVEKTIEELDKEENAHPTNR